MNAGIRPFPPLDPAVERLPPKRLARAGATDGQALAWDAAALAYRPATVGGNDAGWLVYSHTTISGSPSAVEVALPTGDDGRIVRIECHGLGITSDSATNVWVLDISRDGGSNWASSGRSMGQQNRFSDGAALAVGRDNSGFFGCLYQNASITIGNSDRYWGYVAISQVGSTGPVCVNSEWRAVVENLTNAAQCTFNHVDSASTPSFTLDRIDRVRFRTLNNNTLVNGGVITVLYRVVS